MSEAGFWRMSASRLLDGYARREFSPVEVVTEALDRIGAANPTLNAYLAVDREGAMEAGRRAEQAWLSPGEKPPLCGVTASVKDSIEMGGLPTTYGSLAFKDNVQPDSEAVARLRRAGAVILGKTNTPEFALRGACSNRLAPPGTNPWDLTRSAGGSSGGAGAAVCAGLGQLAIGTDSGGSIRQPAALNGVFGLKPSMQRIPSVQTWRAAPGRSHNGILTRTVRDTALAMAAIAGYDERDPDSYLDDVDYLSFARFSPRGKRVALSRSLGRPDVTLAPDLEKPLEEAITLLTELGCKIVPADPPRMDVSNELEPGVWAYSGDHYCAAEGMIPDFWNKHKDDLTDYARPTYEKGRFALAWQYRRILRQNRSYAERMRNWFDDFDFILCPATNTAPTIAETERPGFAANMAFFRPFNHSFNPAATVPFGRGSNDLPVSVQIVGRCGDDVGVLGLAAAMEAARPWAQAWPKFATEIGGL